MAEAQERERLRATFDLAARDYQAARPEYPEALYEALISLTGITPESDELCEVGCASGKATLPLARRGFAITCVELGASLAAEARRNLAGFGRVTVVNADFESWLPDRETRVRSTSKYKISGNAGTRQQPAFPGSSGLGRFGLVFAATAWHWIDPAVKYRKSWSLLRPGGHLAFWSAAHVLPADADPFFAEIQQVYDEIGEGLPGTWVNPTTQTLPSLAGELTRDGLFGDVTLQRFTWEIRYPAEAYIRLLDTFSGHIAMADWQRERLYGEIRRRLALRPDGLLRRHWGGVLHVARKIG